MSDEVNGSCLIFPDSNQLINLRMSYPTTTTDTNETDSNFRWIISYARSSHPDYGPDLIAVRVDVRTVTLIREFLVSLHNIVARGSTMARVQWLGAHVQFLQEQENELRPGGALVGLDEHNALILPPGNDLPASCLNGSEIRSECDALTMLRVSDQFDSEVFASSRIKHTPIEVESRHNIWPLIDAAFASN